MKSIIHFETQIKANFHNFTNLQNWREMKESFLCYLTIKKTTWN